MLSAPQQSADSADSAGVRADGGCEYPRVMCIYIGALLRRLADAVLRVVT